ncbi:hypothetical protein WG66_006508 [Moniliophthora roreri]|nr:hypothetical protein WG66_006508 [Moniliophthora roreri]
MRLGGRLAIVIPYKIALVKCAKDKSPGRADGCRSWVNMNETGDRGELYLNLELGHRKHLSEKVPMLELPPTCFDPVEHVAIPLSVA